MAFTPVPMVGKLLAAVLLGVAEMDQEHPRKRQAVGIAFGKKQGKYRAASRA